MIRRRGAPQDEEPSSEEEDAFSSLALKTKKKETPQQVLELASNKTSTNTSSNSDIRERDEAGSLPIVPSTTSSMKRHHGVMSDSRKAQMDALIQELKGEKTSTPRYNREFAPEKKGSYVEPGEEQYTTNLFVGNIAPHLTEPQIVGLFERFGPLHSVKIMWPRTPEERNRNRLTAFVCYQRRRDAELAMETCSDTDAFRVGRQLMVRWGKNLLNDSTPTDEPYNRPRLKSETEHGATLTDQQQPFNITSGPEHPTRRAVDGSLQLNTHSLQTFHVLTRHNLCASRKAVCEAMAFCFEHSGCSTQISELIKELLLDTQCSVETRVARLYLLSDILSNSQQPGVKNAFRYRDAIEKMAPEVFAGLGESDPTLGRMKRHKIDTAVRSILAAWTNWSVFDATFLDELEARFEGKEIVRQEPVQVQIDNTELESQESEKEEETIILSARGDWTEVTEEGDEAKTPIQMEGTNDREEDDPAKLQDSDLDNLDGEPLDENELDDEGLRRLHFIHHVSDDECDTQIKSAESATSIDEVDGEPLEEGDFAAQ
jgi:hypothetical protein